MSREIYIRKGFRQDEKVGVFIETDGTVKVRTYEKYSKIENSSPALVRVGLGMMIEYGLEAHRKSLCLIDTETGKVNHEWIKIK